MNSLLVARVCLKRKLSEMTAAHKILFRAITGHALFGYLYLGTARMTVSRSRRHASAVAVPSSYFVAFVVVVVFWVVGPNLARLGFLPVFP